MKSKEIDLTYDQCASLAGLQAELRRMCVADPGKLGVMLAQVYPDLGVMRVKVLDYAIVRQLVAILLSVEENEKE